MAKSPTVKSKIIRPVKAWGYVSPKGRLSRDTWLTRSEASRHMTACERFGNPVPPPTESIIPVLIVPQQPKRKAKR